MIYIVEPTPAWQGISSYVDKSDTEVPEVMYPVVGDPPGSINLITMINKEGIYYWPYTSPPQNKIGNWDKVGYKAKFQTEGCLPIYGDTLTDQSFFIDGAFTYLPVLTNVMVPLEEAGNRIFFTPDEWNDIMFILDWTTGKLINGFGPIGAGALTELVPGRSYLLVKNDRNNQFTVEFPDFDPAAGIYATYYNQPDKGKDMASPWNDVINTGAPHALFFMDEILSMFKPGDVIGAFNADLTCVGVAEYRTGDKMFALLAMGDDEMTDAMDGYEAGETMAFRLYRAETGETFDIAFTYDTEFPNSDNTFQVYGISKVTGVTMNVTSTGGDVAGRNIRIYPNPASRLINIASDYNMKHVVLVNYTGQLVFDQVVTGNNYQINVSAFVPGIYYIKIETASGGIVIKKVVIN